MSDYDVCIIGSGSGNTIVDEAFDNYRVALVDDGTFGGTCLNKGCIPTKMFVVPADLASSVDHANRLGVSLANRGADFPAIRDRIFSRIDPISEAGLEWRQQADNVTVFRERAHFVDPHTIQVSNQTISARYFVLAAGSRPALPQIRGLDDPSLAAMIHTSDTVMRLDKLPETMVIVGGGYIAAEFAHIFSGLGTDVTLVNRTGVMLRREDREISRRFIEKISDKVTLRLNQRPISVEPGRRGRITFTAADGFNWEYTYDADVILFATGRVPNSDTLDLDRAGVSVDRRSGLVEVSENQITSQPHIFALGDICSEFQLKHVANAEARTVRQNLLTLLSGGSDLVTTDHRFVPHAIFSNPQIASVGQTEAQLVKAGVPFVKATCDYADVAYGWAMEDSGHFVKLLASLETKQLLGAHIIGPEASVLIQPLIQAMSFGTPVTNLARGQYWIHPALTEVVENALLKLDL